MLLFLLLGCRVAAEAPTCVNDDMHTCSTVEIAHSCNTMFAFDGLTVQFTGGTAPAYDAAVVLDGVETAFRCEDGAATVASGTVWQCDETGFFVSGNGDDVAVTVTPDAGAVITESFAPCWDASEPNGRCCGWNFQATVELAIGG